EGDIMGTPRESIRDIGQALFIVNRHAKTAPDPTHLYQLKNQTLKKLIEEKKAVKVGLHFSNNPKQTYQHSVLLVQIGDYYFHTPPTKEDVKSLNHLGHLDETFRNPKPTLSLSKAKTILYSYLKWDRPRKKNKKTQNRSPFSPSELSPFYHKRKDY